MAANPEGKFAVTGFPTRPGTGLIKASAKFKTPKVKAVTKIPNPFPKVPKKKERGFLGTPPQANGQMINGASTSTSRIGY